MVIAKYQGVVRFLLLATQSCLAGVADSVMSPYYCPLAREHGLGASMCGMVISARFATQIVFLLIFGQVMRKLGARKIYMASVVICATFNMLLATVDMIDNDDLFTVLSFLFVILATVGDAGIFCSIYVLAGQEHISFRCVKKRELSEDGIHNKKVGDDGDVIENKEEEECKLSKDKKLESNASGPAWMETTYACGSMLGPPIGGFIFVLGGFGATILTTGICMVLVGSLTYPLYFLLDNKQGPGYREVATLASNKEDEDDNKNQNNVVSMDNLQLECETEGNSEVPEVTEKRENLSYMKALSNPSILCCCLIQISSGIASSWYLSSLESHLTVTMSLTMTQVGLVYMCPGLVYMLLTPIFGYLLDKGFQHIPILVLATLANISGYLLIGPSSLLGFLSPQPIFTITGLLLHGFAMSATLMTCMNLMLDSTKDPEDESNAGIVTSLWESCEMVGGYLGSTFGGLGAERLGFRGGTNVVLCVETIILVGLLFLFVHLSSWKSEKNK